MTDLDWKDFLNKARNSNLYISVNNAHDIKFIIPYGPEELEFHLNCRQVFSYKVTRHPLEELGLDNEIDYFCGEISIGVEKLVEVLEREGWGNPGENFPKHMWVINVEGGVDINIACLEIYLAWIQHGKRIPLSKEEFI